MTTNINPIDTSDGFRIAAQVSEHACSLPAVATTDWADRAAGCLRAIVPASYVCLIVGTLDASGRLSAHEAVGTAASEDLIADQQGFTLSLRTRGERLGAIGLRPTHQGLREGIVAPASALVADGSWRTHTGIARLWQGVELSDLLVGVARLGYAESGRALIVQIGTTAPDASVTELQAGVLRAVMPLLVRRTLLALGSRRSTASRWLTAREQEVLEHLILGKSVRQIADEIGRSPHTVHDHVKSLHRKLNASSRGELVARALGYIEDGQRIRDQAPDGASEPSPGLSLTRPDSQNGTPSAHIA